MSRQMSNQEVYAALQDFGSKHGRLFSRWTLIVGIFFATCFWIAAWMIADGIQSGYFHKRASEAKQNTLVKDCEIIKQWIDIRKKRYSSKDTMFLLCSDHEKFRVSLSPWFSRGDLKWPSELSAVLIEGTKPRLHFIEAADNEQISNYVVKIKLEGRLIYDVHPYNDGGALLVGMIFLATLASLFCVVFFLLQVFSRYL